MNVTIIGTGNMARGIGTRLAVGGNSVTVIGRDASKAGALAAELQKAAQKGATAKSAPMGAPIQDDVVILALYFDAEAGIIKKYKDQLAGKTVVDICNRLTSDYSDLATPPGSSAAEELAKLLPANARLVKAFNTIFASTLVTGSVAGQPLDVLIAGDDADAKKTVAGLIEAGKLRSLDVGGLKRARYLEGMGLMTIALQYTMGTNFTSAWKFLA